MVTLPEQLAVSISITSQATSSFERITQVNQNTIIRRVKQIGNQLSNVQEDYEIPQVDQLDELQTFIGKKK